MLVCLLDSSFCDCVIMSARVSFSEILKCEHPYLCDFHMPVACVTSG
jgi:hypothetical protein